MVKLLLCKLATLLCGVLAIGIFSHLDVVTTHLHHSDLLGAALGLLSAISGTQWIEYQKRLDAAPNQSAQQALACGQPPDIHKDSANSPPDLVASGPLSGVPAA